MEYSSTLVYKSGRKHSDADCLSRAPIQPFASFSTEHGEDTAFLGGVTMSKVAHHQQSDPSSSCFHVDQVPTGAVGQCSTKFC